MRAWVALLLLLPCSLATPAGSRVAIQLSDFTIIHGTVARLDGEQVSVLTDGGDTLLVHQGKVSLLEFDPNEAKTFRQQLAAGKAPLPPISHQQLKTLVGRKDLAALPEATIRILAEPELLNLLGQLADDPRMTRIMQNTRVMHSLYRGDIAPLLELQEVQELRQDERMQRLLDALASKQAE